MACPLSTLIPFAVPDERRRVGIPSGDRIVEPRDELLLGLWVVAFEGATDENPLDRLSEPMLLHLL